MCYSLPRGATAPPQPRQSQSPTVSWLAPLATMPLPGSPGSPGLPGSPGSPGAVCSPNSQFQSPSAWARTATGSHGASTGQAASWLQAGASWLAMPCHPGALPCPACPGSVGSGPAGSHGASAEAAAVLPSPGRQLALPPCFLQPAASWLRTTCMQSLQADRSLGGSWVAAAPRLPSTCVSTGVEGGGFGFWVDGCLAPGSAPGGQHMGSAPGSERV